MEPSVRVMVAAARLDNASYYELLMVKPGVDRATLQRSFHRFALAFHPDRHRAENEDVQEAAKRVFERGVEAYTVLRDPVFAKLYDRRLASGVSRLDARDFDRYARRNHDPSTPRPAHRTAPPTAEDAFVNAMQTKDGKEVARRIERLIREQRYREAYLQIGLLETIEPNNVAVRQRADRIAAYLKRFGNRGG